MVMPAPQQEKATPEPTASGEGEAMPEPTSDPTPRPTHCFNVIRVEGEFQALCPHSLTIIPTPESGFPPETKYPKPYVKYPKLGSWLENDVIEAEERALAAAGASEDDESISEEYIRVEVGPVGERLDRRGLGCERPGRAD